MALISNGTTVVSSGALSISAGDYVHIANFAGTDSYIQNCFSNTYESYLVVIKKMAGGNLNLRLLTSGTSEFSSNSYIWSNVGYGAGRKGFGTNMWQLVSEANAELGSYQINITYPYQSQSKTMHAFGYHSQNTSDNRYAIHGGGFCNTTTSMSGLRIWLNGGGSYLAGSVWGLVS